jgi:PAS domain-containing protein
VDDCRYCQDKNCHTLLKNAAPQRDAQRKTPGARLPAQAISALKRMEWELARNAHNFLELVIHSAPLAMALVNAQGLFTHVNPQFFQEYGYTVEEMLDRHYSILYADEREMLQVMAALQAQGEVLGREVVFSPN